MPGAVDMNGLLAGPDFKYLWTKRASGANAHKGYEKFVNTSVGPTARLRDGFLYLLAFQHGQARRRFAEVLAAEAATSRERFLANLLAGWSWEAEGDLRKSRSSIPSRPPIGTERSIGLDSPGESAGPE
jgi:hypothetical protein